MATAKKTTTTKKKTASSPRKSTAKTKSQAASASTKRAASRPVVRSSVKRVRRASATRGQQSFVLTRDDTPFFSTHATTQTFYWVLIGAAVIGLGLWVQNVNVQVQGLYNQVELLNAQINTAPFKEKAMQNKANAENKAATDESAQ